MAAIPPPVGFGIFADTWQADGSNRTATNTFGFKNNGLFDAAGCLSNVSSALHSATRPYNVGLVSDTWKLISQYCLINLVGTPSSATTFPGQQGTAGFVPPSPNVSVVVNKHTNFAGRAFRGRVAVPAFTIDESEIDEAGNIDSAVLSAMQGYWNSALSAMSTNGVPMYIIHGPDKTGVTPSPTIVDSVSVSGLVGTQRRRLRR